MTGSRFGALLLGWLGVATLAGPTPARAIPADHLECYKFADSAGARTYTADLDGLRPEPHCRIVAKAKLLCVETAKTNVSPPPPGAPRGSNAGTFLCYTLKCKKAKTPVTVADQFGSRPGQATVSKLLCAPAKAVSTQSTTTTSVSTTSTTTIPCAAGVGVGGACWFLGTSAQSCTDVCTGHSLVYDASTASYAGSGGTLANCEAVLNALGKSGAATAPSTGFDNLGCYFDEQMAANFRNPNQTTAGAAASFIERACACM